MADPVLSADGIPMATAVYFDLDEDQGLVMRLVDPGFELFALVVMPLEAAQVFCSAVLMQIAMGETKGTIQ